MSCRQCDDCDIFTPTPFETVSVARHYTGTGTTYHPLPTMDFGARDVPERDASEMIMAGNLLQCGIAAADIRFINHSNWSSEARTDDPVRLWLGHDDEGELA